MLLTGCDFDSELTRDEEARDEEADLVVAIIWLCNVVPLLMGVTMILFKLFTPFTDCVGWYYVCLPFYQLPFGLYTLYIGYRVLR